MRKIIFVVITMIFSVQFSAQNHLFEQMRKSMNEYSLPLVNLIIDTSKVNRNSYINGKIEIADCSYLKNDSSKVIRYFCKYRYRGASAATYEKKSFAIKLLDEKGKDFDANIFGIREENSWILDAMAIDRTRMRNRICFDVWNDLNHTPYKTIYGNRNGTEGTFVEVFINGDYHGLYCMTDKIDRKLLGLKKARLSENGNVQTKGLLYKGISWGNNTDIHLLSYNEADTNRGTWNSWELQYPDEYPSVDTWQPLMNLIEFCSDKTTNEQFAKGYEEYFFTDNLTDYVVFTLGLGIGDNAYKNTFLSLVDITIAHRFLITPWDMDMSLGGHWNGKYNEILADVNRYNEIAPFNRLIVNNIAGFRDKLKDKWKAHHTTLFSMEGISKRLDNYANMFLLSGAWEREYNKWNENPVTLKESILDELDYIKTWYQKNYDNLCRQFGVQPVNAIVNTTLSTTPHSLNGVYTLDGRKIDKNQLHEMKTGVYIVNGRKVIAR